LLFQKTGEGENWGGGGRRKKKEELKWDLNINKISSSVSEKSKVVAAAMKKVRGGRRGKSHNSLKKLGQNDVFTSAFDATWKENHGRERREKERIVFKSFHSC